MVTRRRGFKRVLKGIDDALEAGLSPVKINTVVMRNFNEDELGDFVELTRDKDIDVRFIEFMPFGGNKWTEGRVFPYSDMVATIQERFPDFASLDSGPHETAKAWKVPGFVGQVGFITSMSDHFCGGCNRLRMTADGNLKVSRSRTTPWRAGSRSPPPSQKKNAARRRGGAALLARVETGRCAREE